MLKMKKITDTYDMKVFTDSGDYFGDVEEIMLTQTKVYGWRVRASKNSFLSKVLGSAKGVIVPHSLVKAIGDIEVGEAIKVLANFCHRCHEPIAWWNKYCSQGWRPNQEDKG